MKHKVLILLIFIPSLLFSQQWKRYRKEYVYGVGATNCLTDLGGANQIGTHFVKDFEISTTRPALLLGYRYRLNQTMAVRGNFIYGRMRADDKLTTEAFRNYRNLTVRTDIVELSGQFEYSFIKEKAGHRYQIKGVKGWKNVHIQMYGFIGLGAFFFNPQGLYTDGRWYNLQPLGTEGQGIKPDSKKYFRLNAAIPAGIGLKYGISRRLILGFELGLRKTFTDFLDDTSSDYYNNQEIENSRGKVAAYLADPSSGANPGWTAGGYQRGDVTKKDVYMFGLFSLSQKIVPKRTKAKF